MDAVSKIYLHAEKVYANGHTIVGLAFVYRGVVVPCVIRLWASKAYCEKSKKSTNTHEHVEFKTLTEFAAEMIETINVKNVIVLFDKFYLCDTIVKSCKNKGFTYIGAVKENRNVFPDGRPKDSG